MKKLEREADLQLRIVVLHPPAGVTFAVQEGRSGLLAPIDVRQDKIVFRFGVRVAREVPGDQPNFLGSFTQGPRVGRFVYVNSGRHAGQKGTFWDRRAKIPLSGLTWSVVKSALARQGGLVEARINGTSGDGGPACGSVPLVGPWRVIPGGGAVGRTCRERKQHRSDSGWTRQLGFWRP